MSTPRFSETALLRAAAARTAHVRAAFLDNACLGNTALRQRLEAKLATHEQKETLSVSSVHGEASATNTAAPLEATDEVVGRVLDHYRLLERLGEGGFGSVWAAEQKEPVRRRVALKIIKLGMDTKAVVARFEAERQTLALMDHPNIARVLDAGSTETGRPYFVMELVRGVPITRYCDQAQLSTENRLDLFIKVCQAIQHAHQKGIIHRDLKPSNILVTLHDGVPVPKVIDFGIAKATQQELTERTIYTQHLQFIGTPAYMSPEQAEMSGLDIDTRSDIYSLGVLLYELLAGSTPFDAKELMSQGIDAMRRTIREKEPLRPSTKLATLQGEALTTTARQRSVEGAKLQRQLKGDLDWIVMKCLEKDRTRRYETANGLSADIKRHLDCEPVVARPPSKLYEFQKTVRRHKFGFGATAAVIIVLALGIALSTWQAIQAARAKGEAEAASLAAKASEQKARDAETGQSRLREQAEAQALAARRTAYSSDMNLAQQALAVNNLGRARLLLDRQRPEPGQKDLRGWEWRYLWSQARADDHEVFFSGTNRLRPVTLSGDGRLLAREQSDETVVTDLISRRTVFQATSSWRPVFAHHAARLAFILRISPTNDAVVVYDVDTRQETRLVTFSTQARWVGFTPDDRQLLTVSVRPEAQAGDALPRLLTAWDLGTGRELWHQAIGSPSSALGRPYALSRDGVSLAACLRGGRVQVLETKDGSERFTIKTTEERTTVVMFSPDSSTLLTGAGYTDSTIRLWDARNGKAGGSLDGHRGWVSDLIFTPDGTQLISSSADQTIRLWDWAARMPVGVLCGHLDEVDGIAISQEGRTLASYCKDGSIYLWDLKRSSSRTAYRTLPASVDGVEFTPDSRAIIAFERNGSLAQLDLHSLSPTRRWLPGATSDKTVARISPDATQAALFERGKSVRVLDLASGALRTNLFGGESVDQCLFTRNGQYLVTGREISLYDGTEVEARVWDAKTWRSTGTFKFRDLGLEGLFAPKLPNSFVGTDKRHVMFWDVTQLTSPPRTLSLGGNWDAGGFQGVDASPDGRLVAGAHENGAIGLWDLETLQPVRSLRGFLLGVHSVTFSPDGTRLAAGSNGLEALKLWAVETWQEVVTLAGKGSLFTQAAFSPDGHVLLAINDAGVCHLWFAPSWEEITAAEAKDEAERKRP